MWQDEAKALIKQFEGLSLKPYRCPAGYNTIGYGHVIKDFEEPLFKAGIGNSEAEIMLIGDMNLANQALTRLVSVPLNHQQRAALVSFVFNVGAGAFQASTMRQKLNRREYTDAAEQFLRWIHGGGRPLPGLVRRRHAERALFLREIVRPEEPVVQADLSKPSLRQTGETQASSWSFLKQAAAFIMGGFKPWHP